MCGFLGVMHATPDAGVDARALARALARLGHRGPDGEGVFTGRGVGLGACRLAVQGDARAGQPATTRDGRFVIAFNGEILGPGPGALRRAIEAAGAAAVDPAAGDVPLLAEAVAALGRAGPLQGPALLALLEGSMGALAVVDRTADEVWLVRDRLGIKPLHVLATDDGVRFSSEIAPLLAACPASRRPHAAGLAELLHFQRPVRTLPFAGVEGLAPGAAWRIRRGGRITRGVGGQGIRDLVDRDVLDAEEALHALGAALEASAAAAASVAGGVSLFLSGGLDWGPWPSLPAGRISWP